MASPSPMSVPHLVIRVDSESVDDKVSPTPAPPSASAASVSLSPPTSSRTGHSPLTPPPPLAPNGHSPPPPQQQQQQQQQHSQEQHQQHQQQQNGAPHTPPPEDEVDELTDEGPPPQQQQHQQQQHQPTPAPAPRPTPSQSQSHSQAHTPSGQSGLVPSPKPSAASGSKSRKSSCDLCHHRKIKCDQVRPSCSSCMRKGHPCHYSEETEANNPHTQQQRRAVSVAGGVDRIEVPRPAAPVRYNSSTGSPAWMSSSSRPKSATHPSRPASAGGSAERKKRLDRDRIVNGYGSSSDEEGGSGGNGSVSVKASGPRAGVDNDLADMLGEPTRDEDDEIDELESSDEHKPKAKSHSPKSSKKRETSVDDELSNDLLELASAPPKKKKARGGVFSAPSQGPRPRSEMRHSLPSALMTTQPSPVNTVGTIHTPSSNRWDSYSVPLVTLMASLPSAETQSILFNTFFSDPFLTEGISLLQPQFVDDFHSLVERRASGKMREGDATTLANAFAFLAVSLRVLSEETGKLLLASSTSAAASNPRSASRIISNQPATVADTTPLDQRYFELALLAGQVAEQRDAPSVMYVVHKLILFRYATLGFRKDRVVLAGGWLAQAIKTAQALGMSKEWEGIPQGERELRRRVMWSLYVADRQFAFDTAFPYTILDTHQGIHLPSPISEADLYKIPPDAPTLPPHSTEAGPTACTALFIHTHLARRITPILDSFATVGPAGTPHDLVLRFDASLDAFQDALPPYLRLFPLTDTRFDSAHPYLAPHRVRLHSTLLAYRLGVHRAHLAAYLSPTSSPGVRAVIAQVCLASLRCQKSAKMLDPKLSPRLFNPASVFEAAATLALIMHVERAVAGPAQQAIAMSTEYLAMRAGVADGSELLDSVGASESGAFARIAVRVLREVIAKVDAGPRDMNGVNGDRERDRDGGRSRSREGSPVSGHVAAIVGWLESWRANGVNIDYLLREADWVSWEKVIAGM